MDIRFTGGHRIEAQFEDFRVPTDQPIADGGTATAPSPFDLFLAALGTCAGYYVLAFCRQRNLPAEGLALKLSGDWNPKRHLFDTLNMAISLPAGFPDKYRSALVRAAGKCTVKRQMETPPHFEITTIPHPGEVSPQE